MATHPNACFRCWKCHDFVRADFKWTSDFNPDDWIGYCPNCEAANILHKPSWTKRFIKQETIR